MHACRRIATHSDTLSQPQTWRSQQRPSTAASTSSLATLHVTRLHEQYLALPAAGVEALLESDDFGTDTESSVLLLLLLWVEHRAPAHRQLCANGWPA